MNIKERVYAYKDEMIETLRTLVSYNSVLDTAEENAPFGKVNAQLLDKALEILEGHGFKTTNLDHYVGYGEVGEGKNIVGVLAHLDIVPAGDGWETDPFVLTEKDGKLYGRGASDDKGPMVAALYAIKILMDMGYQFPKRLRFIVGSNEESGSGCVEYYVSKEGSVQYGFTPDASFPGVHGEKGSIKATFSSKETNILDMNGGTAPNVVCNRCVTLIPSDFCDFALVEEYMNKNNITYELTQKDNGMELIVNGVSAHASNPEAGVNAISHTFAAFAYANSHDPFVELYNKLIGLCTDGSKCGIQVTDDYGTLTFNNGMIYKENGVISGSIDIRVPITAKSSEIADTMSKAFEKEDFPLVVEKIGKGVYFELDHPLVTTLLDAYRTVTNDFETKPATMGGGTYSQHIDNVIGFGAGLPGSENPHMHDANEFILIDNFMRQTEIYVEAIKRLCEL